MHLRILQDASGVAPEHMDARVAIDRNKKNADCGNGS
jgi:hypothetical protein